MLTALSITEFMFISVITSSFDRANVLRSDTIVWIRLMPSLDSPIKSLISERTKSISDRIPADRWGTPEDLKGPAVFLASKASDYINGHILLVDGGWMAR